MPSLPDAAQYVLIGAGIHGLSTAMHLAQRLRASGKSIGTGGTRIVVLDKSGVGAGASGIACGVVRNNYYQPAMRELMAHSVSVWERDPSAYSYHPVGYMQISPDVMHAQVGSIYEQQKAIGYESVFIEGERESLGYMKELFSDWQARNITSVLHEKRGGYANNLAAVRGLADKATALGVEIGCFTPDSFPVFDRFRDNVYVIADSNHGFKMIGVGELVAGELLGDKAALLTPFRYARYAEGRLHPVSNSPFPWS